MDDFFNLNFQKTTLFVVEQSTLVDEIDLWIIIVSIVGAVVLLIIVILILWKVSRSKLVQVF